MRFEVRISASLRGRVAKAKELLQRPHSKQAAEALSFGHYKGVGPKRPYEPAIAVSEAPCEP